MITVTIDCDKCGTKVKTFKTLLDMTEMVQDYPNLSTETGFILCPECYDMYFKRRRELKEQYNEVINGELRTFVKGHNT